MVNLNKVGIFSVGISALVLLIAIFGPLFFGGEFRDDGDALMQMSAGPISIVLIITLIYLFVLVKGYKQNITPSKAKNVWAIIILVADIVLLLIYWNLSNCHMPNTFSGCAFALLGFAIGIVAPVFILQFILYLWFSISLSKKMEFEK